MDSFSEGFEFFQKNVSGTLGAFVGECVGSDLDNQAQIADSVNKEVDNFVEHLNAFKTNGSQVDQLSGKIAEAWHADTYNINAARLGVDNRVHFNTNEHGFASADLFSDLGGKASLKYYKDAASTAREQGRTYQEAAHKSVVAAQKLIDGSAHGRELIYGDMQRICPADQIDEIRQKMSMKVTSEMSKRPDQVYRYEQIYNLSQETYKEAGVESNPLTREGSKEVTRELKEKKELTTEDLEKYGVSKEYVDYKVIIGEALKAGLTAATITAVLKAAPDLYKAIDYLIRNGEADEEALKEAGTDFLVGGAEGFARGSVSAAIVACCKAGFLGEAAKDINPSIVGIATVIAIDTMKNAHKVARGLMSKNQMADEIIKEMYVSACSLVLGTVTQAAIEIPVLGYLIGNFIGSIAGSLTYKVGQKVMLSFCVNSGITMFGLVGQDYCLPNDVLAEMGVDVFEYENMAIDEFVVDEFKIDCFEVEQFVPNTIDISFVRRGVIGVAKVGYLVENI